MIQREFYLKAIRPFMHTDVVKILIGLKGSGKTSLLESLQQELLAQGIDSSQILMLSFEDPSLAYQIGAKALHDAIVSCLKGREGKLYLFLDEIKEIDGWPRAINAIRTELDCDIYLASSSAAILEDKEMTYLAGRYVKFFLYPFSLTEYRKCLRQTYPEMSRSESFCSYMEMGGMPFLANLDLDLEVGEAVSPHPLSWKSGEISQAGQISHPLLRDFLRALEMELLTGENAIRDPRLLERLLLILMEETGKELSLSYLSLKLKEEGFAVRIDRARAYLQTLQQARLIYPVYPEEIKKERSVSITQQDFLLYPLHQQESSNEKILTSANRYYLADHGFLQAFSPLLQRDVDLCTLLENMIVCELLKRGYQISTGKIEEQPISFIARKRGEKLYIQLTDYLYDKEKTESIFAPLYLIPDNFPKYVISLDPVDLSRDGIKQRTIWDFLLAPDWN